MQEQIASEPELPLTAKYTALWQEPDPTEANWIREIFGELLGDWVVDGKREMVLDHVILFDHFVTAQDPAYYARFRGRDAFLVDFSDENYDFRPEIYANFRGVIRAYWSDVFRPEAVRFLPLGYTRNLRISDEPLKSATKRQYVWSFLGQVNKSSRPDMARALATVEPHLLFATDKAPGFVMWNRGPDGPRRYQQAQNTAIMLDSIFAPCPMGNVNVECYRVYEALECGTVPIVEKRLTLDYFRSLWGKHPVPAVSSWQEARGFLRRSLEDPAGIDVLQSRCMEWWQQWKRSHTVSLGQFMAVRSASEQVLRIEDMVLPKSTTPGWKLLELMRHHDSRALIRRVQRQAARLMQDGKLRESHNAKRPVAKL